MSDRDVRAEPRELCDLGLKPVVSTNEDDEHDQTRAVTAPKLNKAQRLAIGGIVAPTLREERPKRKGRIVVVDHETGAEKGQLESILDVTEGVLKRKGIEFSTLPPDPKDQKVCAGQGDGTVCPTGARPPRGAFGERTARGRNYGPWRCRSCAYKHTSPEAKDKRAAAQAAAMARPGVREKQAATMARPEVKAKKANTMAATMARPDVKAKQAARWEQMRDKMAAGLARPEVKEKQSAAIRAALARPEVKEKQSAARASAMALLTSEQKAERSSKAWATRRAKKKDAA